MIQKIYNFSLTMTVLHLLYKVMKKKISLI